MNETISRRTFLKVAGLGTVSIAAFGLTGCGGGGSSSSPTGKVYTMLKKDEMKRLTSIVCPTGNPDDVDLKKLTQAQKEQIAQIIPYCNDVFFYLDGAYAEGNTYAENQPAEASGDDMVTLIFEVGNTSNKPVKFERSEREYFDAMLKLSDFEGDEKIEAAKKAGLESTQFTAEKAKLIISYGMAENDENGTQKVLGSGEIGYIYAAVVIPKDWTTLRISFKPNFSTKGEAFTFELNRSDLAPVTN